MQTYLQKRIQYMLFYKRARYLPLFKSGTATTATSSDLLCCSLETIIRTLRGNCNIYNILSHGTCETWFPVDLCLESEFLELICQTYLEPNLDSTNLTLPFLGSVVLPVHCKPGGINFE